MQAGRTSDDQSLESWTDFLRSYANGQLSPDQSLAPPPLSTSIGSLDTGNHLPDGLGTDFDRPVYDSVEISPHIACRVREFYRQNHFLPPPRAPLENLRETCIQEYDLYSDKQVQNVQSATDLIQAFFGGICTFTLFRDNVQELTACSGPPEILQKFGLLPGKRLLPETSLCGHSVLYADRSNYIPNLAEDWRYMGNPYADNVQGIKSYVGSVVALQVDPASLTDDRVVSVGVINSMHFDYLPPLSEQQNKVLGHVTRMLETQLRATWEGHERTREARAQRAVSGFIESALVDPVVKIKSFTPEEAGDTAGSSSTLPSVLEPIGGHEQISGDRSSEEDEGTKSSLQRSAQLAARHIQAVLQELDSVTILDLRSLHPVKERTGNIHFVPTTEQNSPMGILAWQCSTPNAVRPDFQSSQGSNIIIQYLERYLCQSSKSLADDTDLSGFELFFPPPTRCRLVLPFFTGIQPLFMILITIARPAYALRASETSFLSSIGVVLRAQMLQSRVIEADAAKTAFLSSISHELRTPMHGVLSGLQLVRDAVIEEDLGEVEKLLTMTESSGYALQHILNDVLDFGSIANGRKGSTRRSLTDLAKATLAAAKTCSRGMAPVVDGTDVDLIVELEDRDWRALVDEAGYQRILFNGLTNALKFTKRGRITLSLTSSTNNHHIICRVIDTGPGIDPNFTAKLFEPFTKADSFAPGAGLGLYITKSLADRMGGTVTLSSRPEGGAVFEVNLPVELLGTKPESISMTRHTVVNEVVRAYSSDGDLSELSANTTKSLIVSSRASSRRSPPPPCEVTDVSSSESEAIRVLVADDNMIGRKILLTLLEQIGRKQAVVTKQAVDGVEALEVFKEIKPHLVLTDVSMPRMDGITAASEMRELEKAWGRPRCQIFAITGLGSSDPRLKMDALKGSAALDGWLIKGQDKLSRIKDIVSEVRKARRPSINI